MIVREEEQTAAFVISNIPPLPYVLKARAKKMMKRVNYYLAKNAKRSGFGYSK